MTGMLFLNGDRPDIIFPNGQFYGGLHCGDCFKIYRNEWVNVRLEFEEGWILIHNGKKLKINYGEYVDL